MKKYLLLIGAVLLVLALASPSMAQFKSWGYLEFHTIYAQKPDFGQGNRAFGGSADYKSSTGTASVSNTGASNTAYPGYITPTSGSAIPSTAVNVGDTLVWRKMAERFRFWLQYGDPKTIRGVIGFEADSANYGEAPWTNADATTLSSSGNTVTANPSGRMGMINNDQVQLEIKHAFIDMMIPTTPLMLTLGMQSYLFGGRFMMARDAPGAVLTVNFAPHMIRGGWFRYRDVDELKYNVADNYFAEYQINQKAFNAWAYTLYLNDLSNSEGLKGAASYDDHPWWVGVGGEFRPGNLLFNGSFHYLFGKKDFKHETTTVVDQDYSAWAGELLAQYRIGPGLFVRGEVAYSSGNDADKTDKLKRWTFPSGSEQQWSFGNGRSVFFWMNGDVGFYEAKVLDYTGQYYGRLNFEYSPTAWLMLNFNYLYIGDSSKGTPGSGKTVNSPVGAQQTKDEDYIGSELNVIAKIKVYQNVLYGIGFGYFLPGEVYDHYTAAGVKDRSPDNAWAIHSRLMCTF